MPVSGRDDHNLPQLSRRAGSEYSIDLRQKVILLHLDGKGYKKIAQILSMPVPSVQSIVMKFKKNGVVVNLPRSGRLSLLNDRTRKYITRQIRANRRLSPEDLRDDLMDNLQLSVCVQTIRNAPHEKQLFGRAARKKPCISKINKSKRLQYARDHLDWTTEDWQRVMFTDESKFNLHQSDGRVYVWRHVGEEFDDECIKTTFKGSVGVMVWGCIGWNGVGSLHFCTENVNQTYYQHILNVALPESIGLLDLPDDFVFMQDNAPAHKAKSTRRYFETNGIEILNHPPQSPDLNPIEHVWCHMSRELMNAAPKTLQELTVAIENAWLSVPLKLVRTLIGSMPRRLRAVVRNNGGQTKY